MTSVGVVLSARWGDFMAPHEPQTSAAVHDSGEPDSNRTDRACTVAFMYCFAVCFFLFLFQYNLNLNLWTGFGAHCWLGSLGFGTGFGTGSGMGWGTMFGPGFGTVLDRDWCWASDGFVIGSDKGRDRHWLGASDKL